jgi:hypothetical protein
MLDAAKTSNTQHETLKWATVFETFLRAQATAWSSKNRFLAIEFNDTPGEGYWKYFPFESPTVLTTLAMRDPLQRIMSDDMAHTNLTYW